MSKLYVATTGKYDIETAPSLVGVVLYLSISTMHRAQTEHCRACSSVTRGHRRRRRRRRRSGLADAGLYACLISHFNTYRITYRIGPPPGNWLGPEGHADLKNPVDDPSLCSLCNFPLKLFKNEADIMSSLNEFHLLTILSEKKCCLRSVITRFLCYFRVSSCSFVMTEFKKCAEPDS